MTYHVSRNGQMYGPYTLEDLQRYVATGNILPTDMAKSEDMPDWLPVAQILGTAFAADGRQVRSLDQTGLAQKGGAVVSDLCVSTGPAAR